MSARGLSQYTVTHGDGSKELLPIVASYDYRDDDGEVLYTVGRTAKDKTGAKHFPAWRADPADPARYVTNLRGVARVLFRQAEVREAAHSGERIYAGEGEKDVLRLVEAFAVCATTSPHGAGKWRDDYSAALLGASLVVILPDNDEPGRKHGRAVADSLSRAAVPCVIIELPALPEKGDVSDWIEAGGTLEELDSLVAEALLTRSREREAACAPQTPLVGCNEPLSKLGDDADLPAIEAALRAVVERSLSLDALGRATVREAAIKELKRLHVQSGARLVDAALGAVSGEDPGVPAGANRIALVDPEPWPEAVDGAALLEAVCAVFSRFIVLPPGALEAIALWTLYAHAHEAFFVSPRLALYSPEKRCGKTHALTILGTLVPRPLPASNISAAGVFRTIDKYRPTLLLDEAETFLRDNEELRGILNSGHTCANAFVVRLVGEQHEPVAFSTFAPIAFALIGKLPSTLEDRSVVIPMRRRRRDEVVARLRIDKLTQFVPLQRQAARWAADNLAALREADPEVPEMGSDRAADNWRPLLAIADAAGGAWPLRARRALRLLLSDEIGDDSAGVQLLSDVRDLFVRRGAERLASEDVARELAGLEERPWPEWRAGTAITAPQVAKLLKPFAVRPKPMRIGAEKTKRGYELGEFVDAFARYLPEAMPVTPVTCLQNSAFTGVTEAPAVTPEKVPMCSDVTAVTQESLAWSDEL